MRQRSRELRVSIAKSVLILSLCVSIFPALVKTVEAAQVTVMTTEMQAQRTGTLVSVSCRLVISNSSPEFVENLEVINSDGSSISIGSIAPQDQVTSPSLVFTVDVANVNMRNVTLPITLQYLSRQGLETVSAGINFEIPQE